MLGEVVEPSPCHLHERRDLVWWSREVFDREDVDGDTLDVEPEADLEHLSGVTQAQPERDIEGKSGSDPAFGCSVRLK